jgi:hypothetical protein
MSEQQAEYLTDALEMIGMNEPAIEIERSRTVVTRRNGKLTEEVRPAFVKISTAFKGEMKKLDPIALKVWLYIALSVNRNSGKANPGLRTIAEDCDLAINTVRAALERLEEAQLLTVDRQSRKYNIYEPVDYVSANRAAPTVSSTDTDAQTVSISGETVSISGETVSPRMILNQRNQNQPEHKKDFIDGMLEIAQMPGAKKAIVKQYIAERIKSKLGLNPSGKDAESFIDYAANEHKKGNSFDAFLSWWIENNPKPEYWSFRRMEQMYPRAFQAITTNQPIVTGGNFYA